LHLIGEDRDPDLDRMTETEEQTTKVGTRGEGQGQERTEGIVTKRNQDLKVQMTRIREIQERRAIPEASLL